MAADGDPLEFDLLAASLRQDSGDHATFIESLAVKLEDTLPGLVRVQRGRRGLRGPKVVRLIAIEAGGERLELTRNDADVVEARRARMSGGIVLKTEPMAIDAWTDALTELLAAQAEHNERTRQALSRLLLD